MKNRYVTILYQFKLLDLNPLTLSYRGLLITGLEARVWGVLDISTSVKSICARCAEWLDQTELQLILNKWEKKNYIRFDSSCCTNPPSFSDYSPSMNIIEKLTWNLFKSAGNENKVNLLPGGSFKTFTKSNEAEIIVQGLIFNGLRAIKDYNSYKLYRFWCFSLRHKEILSSLFNIPSETTGVLPILNVKDYKPNSRSKTLVYVGRLTDSKGVEVLIEFKKYLNNYIDTELLIYSSTNVPQSELSRQILNNELTDHNIFFKGNSGILFENIFLKEPTYISFSLDVTEDFALAPRLAKSLNWNLFLSNWGAHADIAESSDQLISSMLIVKRDFEKIKDVFINREASVIKNSLNSVDSFDSIKFLNYESFIKISSEWTTENTVLSKKDCTSHLTSGNSLSEVAKKMFFILSGGEFYE